MKKLLFVLTIAFLMLIAVNIVNLFAEPKPQEGNPGLPGCLAQVDQLQQTIADQQATIAEQEATILALQEQIATSTTSLEYALPNTGITASSSPGDDGALQKGVSWPNP